MPSWHFPNLNKNNFNFKFEILKVEIKIRNPIFFNFHGNQTQNHLVHFFF